MPSDYKQMAICAYQSAMFCHLHIYMYACGKAVDTAVWHAEYTTLIGLIYINLANVAYADQVYQICY